MRFANHILNGFITATILLVFERIFAFTDSLLQFQAWLLIVAFLFLFVSLTVFLGSFIAWVFRLLERGARAKWLKPVIVAGPFFTAMYLLGFHLSTGNWIKTQSWVEYFPLAVGSASAIGSVIVFFLFERVRRSKLRRIFGCLGVLITVGLLYFHSEISGGVYHRVYLTIYVLSTIVLSLSVSLLDFKMPFKKTAYVVFGIVLSASIFTLGKTTNMARANADVNSLTFSNLTGTLLPRQKMTFLEKVLVGNSAILPPEVPEVKREIGNAEWNVLFVVVDTLRADIFEPWRRGDITTAEDTPFMDSFFKDSVHFERGYTQGSGTLISMPSLFRSLEVNEKVTKFGRPLGRRFSSHGFGTFAVVNNFFIEPRYLRTRSLLDGFEDVKVYQKRTQNDLLKLTRKSFEQYQNEKWFAWIHFYNMHHTAFDGTFLKGVPKKEAYRRAAGWLDSQMEAIVDALKAKKLLSKTIIVFTADHGENLGDNGLQAHGRSVWEEEVRSPIAIRIPGVDGILLDGTVGNIDLVPTLLDLLKLPKDPTLAGRSLVPFIANREPIPDRSYYLTNVARNEEAIVRGNHKLIYKSKKGILQRFDLDADPEEKTDLFVPSGDKELRLRRDLVFHNPKIVTKELKIPAMQNMLLEQIKNVDKGDNQSSLFYAKLIAQHPTSLGMKKISAKIIEKNNRDFSQHYRILCRSKFARTIRVEMKRRLEDKNSRKEMLGEIVDLYCPSFHNAWVGKMMKSAKPEERKFWLSLSLRYTERQRGRLIPLMSTWLEDETLGTQERLLIYQNIRHLGRVKKLPEHLVENIRRDLTGDELTAESAIQALGKLGDKRVSTELIAMLESSKSLRIKQAILMTLATIDAENAFEIISKKMEEEPILAFNGAKAIMALGDERGVTLLDEYGRNYPNHVVRSKIRKFAKKLRKKIARKKKK